MSNNIDGVYFIYQTFRIFTKTTYYIVKEIYITSKEHT